jgi:hypothetical protein
MDNNTIGIEVAFEKIKNQIEDHGHQQIQLWITNKNSNLKLNDHGQQ